MEIAANAPVTLTVGAVAELKRLIAADPTQPPYLRVGVKGGGCSGMSYILGFDEKEQDDEQFEISGIPVLMKKAHGMYLAGIEIDYRIGLDARGFTFQNPNASKSCGCGSSFAV